MLCKRPITQPRKCPHHFGLNRKRWMDGRADRRRTTDRRITTNEDGKREGRKKSEWKIGKWCHSRRSLTPSPVTSREARGKAPLQWDGRRGALSATPESDLALKRLNYAVPLRTLTPRRASGGMSSNQISKLPPFSPGPWLSNIQRTTKFFLDCSA